MATWPPSLPQRVLLSDLVESADPNVVRFDTEYGPAKLRRRATRETGVYQVGLILTTAQVATLETFYLDTLGQVDPFDWLHPRTLAAHDYRFRSRPEKRPLGRGFWKATFTLEDAW